MTNKEYLIKCLNNEIDDDGASYEAEVINHINCPYYVGDERAWCEEDDFLSDIESNKCFGCKNEWLNNEVDE